MKIKYLILALAMIVPGLLMPMEKEISRKRPAHVLEEPNEQNRAKIESFVACLPKLAPKPSKLVINAVEELGEKSITKVPRLALKSSDSMPQNSAINEDSTDEDTEEDTEKKASHTKEKHFKCDYEGCNYAAAWKGDLLRHQKTHTKEKPFTCTYKGCSQACMLKYQLTMHMRIHTREKPFTCIYEGCNYAAARKGDLVRHQRTHTGEKPFTCTYEGCNYAAARKSCLITHIKKQHKQAETNNLVSSSTPSTVLATLASTMQQPIDLEEK